MRIPALVAITALTLCVLGGLLFAPQQAYARQDWRDKSIFDRPKPGLPTQTAQSTEATTETPAENKPAQVEPQVPKPLQPEVAPLSPELDQEFNKARKMEVSEYLATYGGGKAGQEYRLGPMDIINIQVFDEPDLTREGLRISADGTITIPLVGSVKVEGLTTAQAESLIAKLYKDEGYLRNPHITISIRSFKSRRVLIMGAVNIPGPHSMEGSERLLEMLAKAGGIKFDPDGDVLANSIRILRTVKSPGKPTERISMEMDLESLTKGAQPQYNLIMQDQDVVYVPESPRFFVTGEVKAPGYYKIKDRPVSVVEAITMAGGGTRTAALNRTKVVRLQDGKEVTMEVPVDDILEGDKSKDILVHPNDVIFVPQSYF